MIYRRIKSRIDAVEFYIRNVRAANKIGKIKTEVIDTLIFRGYCSSDEKSISEIYKNLNDGAIYSLIQRMLFSRIGRQFMFVVEEIDPLGKSQIVGMNMYYLNKRDHQENTIHEGFIGVLPKIAGQGVATKMREMAVSHFKMARFSGISTRISLNNVASLVSARKIGFQTVEEYQEQATCEQRLYMVFRF